MRMRMGTRMRSSQNAKAFSSCGVPPELLVETQLGKPEVVVISGPCLKPQLLVETNGKTTTSGGKPMGKPEVVVTSGGRAIGKTTTSGRRSTSSGRTACSQKVRTNGKTRSSGRNDQKLWWKTKWENQKFWLFPTIPNDQKSPQLLVEKPELVVEKTRNHHNFWWKPPDFWWNE